ncbi:Copiatype Polyprotein [Phytophthora palmivora]|uniref:Copiatype Polyprotein n=1 Tax=Phytophthora palmivora TaxID=4796 RepID=A0A2P4X602_9STRA|nr:Copiatype Polyprotein [Phytophthora palmivora]
MMKGKKPDMHRIKKFGSIAYVHKPIGPSRKKLDDNCRLGFLVGYLEGQAGYEVYYPPEHVVQHVEHAFINEDIVYKDRYGDNYSTSVADWIFNIKGAELNNGNGGGDNDSLSGSEVLNDVISPMSTDSIDPDLPDYEDLEEIPTGGENAETEIPTDTVIPFWPSQEEDVRR